MVQSIALPTTVSGANRSLVASGTATSEGLLTRSVDGNYLILTGYYDPMLSTPTNLGNTASTTVNRVIGRIDINGNVDTTTALTDASTGNNPRSAISTNGTDFWIAGGAGGVRYTTLGATTSTQLQMLPNIRQVNIFGGQLYASTTTNTANGSNPIPLGTIGSGTPTTTGQTFTALPGLPGITGTSYYSFQLLDLTASVPGVDTLYIADDGVGQIQKFSLVSGSWVTKGFLTASLVRGLTSTVNGSTVNLYGTTGGNGATLYGFADTTGYNGTISGAVTTLATAAMNTAFRGVAITPGVLPDLTITSTAPSSALVGTPYAYTLTVNNSGTTNLTGLAVNFTLPTGVTYQSASGTGFTATQTAGIVSFTGGTIAANGTAALTVNVTPTAAGTINSAIGTAVVDPTSVANPNGTILESNEANNSSTVAVATTVTANPQPDLTITSSAPTTAVAGTPFNYTLSVNNVGTANATGVGVQFTLPTGVTYNSATGAGGFTATQSAGVVTFTGGNLTATNGTAALTVNVTPTAAGTIASAIGAAIVDPANTILESIETNNSSTAAVATTVTAALVVTLSSATFTNEIVLPGNVTDLTPLNGGSGGANINRLGAFGSDFFYDYNQNVYYGLVDRGPGGGVIPYQTRVQQFSLDVDKTTGAISNFKLLKTIPFTVPAGATVNGVTASTQTPFNGLSPLKLNGSGNTLGLSQDPEGFTVGANGNFFVSDEYGPSIYEFTPTGSFVRAFTEPTNVVAKQGTTTPYYDADNITSGRQDNRGYEGLAVSPDGTKLYAMLQDPLQNDGSPNGRSSSNVRIVRFDVASGKSDAQYIYQLESVADINARITASGSTTTFSPTTAQGRNIGISSLIAVSDTQFLVLERDNRGVGVDDPLGTAPIGTKRVYKIDLTGATDVSGVDLTNTNTLPTGVKPVSKSLFLDIAGSLPKGEKVPEKFEGITFGPQLADGSYALILGTDNDFSVTQNSSNTQFDVVTDGKTSQQIPLGSTPPAGFSLIPNYIYSFKTQPNAIALSRTPKSSPDATLTQNSNKLFQIGGSTGTAQLKFSKVSGDARAVNEIGAFLVDDDAGKIGSLSPGQAGYIDAALKRAKVIFSSLPSGDFESGNNTSQLTFNTGSRLGFFLVANGTIDTARTTSNPGNILFGFPSGNPNNQDQLRVSQTGTDPFTLSWEDGAGGGDKDYNDIVLNVQVTKDAAPIGTRQQGDAEIIDLTDYAGRKLAADVVVTGSAAYNDFVGLYKIDDATGKIGNLKPGDAGYAKAALERAVVEYGNRNTRVLGQLDGGGLLAPFIIANASREQLLSQNPTNQSGSNPIAYFSFLGANPDGVDHIRLLGNNTFGFEDLNGGGDKDFNDAVFQVNNLRVA